MYTIIFRLLCILLLILFAFLIGVSISISKKPTIIDGAKLMVTDYMYHPQAADFKDVEFHASSTKMANNVIGKVCGKVFTFKDDAPYKYKRFIVQVAENKDGRNIFSLPLFDFEGEMIPEPDFQKIWNKVCN